MIFRYTQYSIYHHRSQRQSYTTPRFVLPYQISHPARY